MGRIKGVYNEHKDKILEELDLKQRALLNKMEKQNIINHLDRKRIGRMTNPHDVFREIFKIVEHNNFEDLFIEIVRPTSDTVAQLISEPPRPKFVKELQPKVYAKIGDTVKLECKLDKRYTIEWMQNNSFIDKMDPPANLRVETVGKEHNLTIHGIKKTDFGRYTAHCGDEATECALKEEICVRFLEELKDMTVTVGEDVTLKCVLSEKRDTRWFKDGKQITGFTNKKNEIVFGITEAKKSNSGTYCCKVGSGNAETSCTLTVNDADNLHFTKELDDIVVQEGNSVDLSCALNVPMAVEWFKDSVNITPTTKEQKYHCIDLGTASTDIGGSYVCRCNASVMTYCRVSVREGNQSCQQAELSVSDLKQHLRDARDEARTFKANIEILEREKDSLLKEVGELKKNKSKNEEEIVKKTKKIQNLQNKIESHHEQYTNLQSKLQNYLDELHKQDKIIETQHVDIEKLVEIHHSNAEKETRQQKEFKEKERRNEEAMKEILKRGLDDIAKATKENVKTVKEMDTKRLKQLEEAEKKIFDGRKFAQKEHEKAQNSHHQAEKLKKELEQTKLELKRKDEELISIQLERNKYSNGQSKYPCEEIKATDDDRKICSNVNAKKTQTVIQKIQVEEFIDEDDYQPNEEQSRVTERTESNVKPTICVLQ